MPQNKPTIGPMRTQPLERASIMPSQVLPMMLNGRKGEEGARTKAKTNKDGSSARREG
jgi:hypothetical protein